MSVEKKHTITLHLSDKHRQKLYDLIDFSDNSGKRINSSMENYLEKLLLNNSSPQASDSLVTMQPQGAEVTAPLLSIPNIGNASETIDSGFSEKQKQKLRFETEKARIKTQAKIDAEKGVQVVKERVKRYHQSGARGTFEMDGNGGIISDIIGWV